MALRYVVQDTYQIPGRGPMVSGVLMEGDVRTGDTLMVAESKAPVRVLSVDVHTRQTDEGLLVGLRLHPEDASAVTAGSTLVSPPEA